MFAFCNFELEGMRCVLDQGHMGSHYCFRNVNGKLTSPVVKAPQTVDGCMPIKVGDMVPCPMCDGRGYECVSDDGWTQVPVVCDRCEGTRVVAVEKRKDDDE